MKGCTLMIAICMVLWGCEKGEKPVCCIAFDNEVIIRLVNTSQQNLLDPAVPGSFAKTGIRIYDLVEGQSGPVPSTGIEVFKVDSSSKDFPNEYLVRVFTNIQNVQRGETKNMTTYIEWNKTDTDTIVCRINKPGGSVFCEKVWYNGAVVWDPSGNPPVNNKTSLGRFFQITK